MKPLTAFTTWPVQNSHLEALYRLIEAEKAPHAILLVGPEAKTYKLAEYLAKLFLCREESAPCGMCDSCAQFAAGNHPDYVTASAPENGSLKTTQIEEIQSRLKVRSHHGWASVYVLAGVETATPVAANRLLKTLEEPSAQVKAILTTVNPGRILPTIRSRLFAYSVQDEDMVTEGPQAETALTGVPFQAEFNEGFVSTLEPVIKWTYSWLAQREPSLILAASLLDISGTAHEVNVLSTVILWLRELVHYRVGITTRLFREYQADAEKQAGLATVQQLARASELVSEAKSRLQAHVAANLNFEQLCIRLRGVL